MPQMAPLNWLILFFLFTLIFITFNSMNFYFFKETPQTLKFSKKISSSNWKW